ncbi:MAG: hypothetical protein MHM6MM_002035 [Cercozoa sp. M6MM]
MRQIRCRARRLVIALFDVVKEATVCPTRRLYKWAYHASMNRYKAMRAVIGRAKRKVRQDESDGPSNWETARLLKDQNMRRRKSNNSGDSDTTKGPKTADKKQLSPPLYYVDVVWLLVVISMALILRAGIGALRTKWLPVHHTALFNDMCDYNNYKTKVCQELVTIHQLKPLYELGSGAIGRVFAAEHLPTKSVIAVKVEVVRDSWDRRAMRHETSIARYVRDKLIKQGKTELAEMFVRPLFASVVSPEDALWLGARIDAAGEGDSFDMDSDSEFWLRELSHGSTKNMNDAFVSLSDDARTRNSAWWRRRGFATEAAEAREFAIIGFELGELGSLWDQRRSFCSWYNGDVGELRIEKLERNEEVDVLPYPESMALMFNATSRETRLFRWLSARLVAALNALHSLGIVHRDVKAANVFVSTGGRIMLGDLSNAVFTESYWQRFGRTGGTRKYFSPEQWRIKWLSYTNWRRWWENYDVGPASDYWSLGITLWRMRNYCLSRRAEYPFRFVDSPMSREKSRQLTYLGLPAYPPYSWQRTQEQIDQDKRRPMWKFVTSMLRRDPERRLQSKRDICRSGYLRRGDLPAGFCD